MPTPTITIHTHYPCYHQHPSLPTHPLPQPTPTTPATTNTHHCQPTHYSGWQWWGAAMGCFNGCWWWVVSVDGSSGWWLWVVVVKKHQKNFWLQMSLNGQKTTCLFIFFSIKGGWLGGSDP